MYRGTNTTHRRLHAASTPFTVKLHRIATKMRGSRKRLRMARMMGPLRRVWESDWLGNSV